MTDTIDDEPKYGRSIWASGLTRLAVDPGALDRDATGRIPNPRFRFNFDKTFNTVFNEKAEAEKRSMLLGRLVPFDEYNRIMNLSAVDRWNTIHAITDGKDLATTAIRPLLPDLENDVIIHNSFRAPLFDDNSHRSDNLIVQAHPNNNYHWKGTAESRRHYGYDIGMPSSNRKRQLSAHVSQEKLKDYARQNGYGGGCMDGSVPAGAHGNSAHLPWEDYAREIFANLDECDENLLHEGIHAVTPNPLRVKNQKISRTPGVPDTLYFSHLTEMVGALSMLKIYSSHQLHFTPTCSDDLDLLYKAVWRPDDDSTEADIHRSHLPMHVRRIFYHWDIIRKEGDEKKWKRWIDKNNLMNQVNNEFMSKELDKKSYSRLA